MYFQMTGLDVEKDRIIEIACLVTTGQLDIVAEVMSLLFLYSIFFMITVDA